jgi:hypothetical protein
VLTDAATACARASVPLVAYLVLCAHLALAQEQRDEDHIVAAPPQRARASARERRRRRRTRVGGAVAAARRRCDPRLAAPAQDPEKRQLGASLFAQSPSFLLFPPVAITLMPVLGENACQLRVYELSRLATPISEPVRASYSEP